MKNEFIINWKFYVPLSLLMFAAIGLAGCKPSNPYVYVTIAEDVELTETPTVFEFAPAFRPYKQVNDLCYTFDQEFPRDSTMKPPRFPDGELLTIENELFDSQGNKIALEKTVELGGNLVCYTPQDYSAWLGISKTNTAFVKLVVRTRRPIRVLKLQWKSHNAWDKK